jgi:hypothetical protein
MKRLAAVLVFVLAAVSPRAAPGPTIDQYACNRLEEFFDSYTGSIQSQFFGRPQSAGNPRQVQLGVRFDF